MPCKRKDTMTFNPSSTAIRGRAPAAAALCLGLLLSATPPASAQELVIGEERVDPGIVFIFEGAVRDLVSPTSQNLAEDLTHVHIEARVNWDAAGIPEGTPPEGFVPYLNVHALVQNEMTGEIQFVSLLPHINLIDNFHYARNMQLPGGRLRPVYRVLLRQPPRRLLPRAAPGLAGRLWTPVDGAEGLRVQGDQLLGDRQRAAARPLTPASPESVAARRRGCVTSLAAQPTLQESAPLPRRGLLPRQAPPRHPRPRLRLPARRSPGGKQQYRS